MQMTLTTNIPSPAFLSPWSGRIDPKITRIIFYGSLVERPEDQNINWKIFYIYIFMSEDVKLILPVLTYYC
jgi:hypothetical protein